MRNTEENLERQRQRERQRMKAKKSDRQRGSWNIPMRSVHGVN